MIFTPNAYRGEKFYNRAYGYKVFLPEGLPEQLLRIIIFGRKASHNEYSCPMQDLQYHHTGIFQLGYLHNPSDSLE
jgi:hypothetical protein